MMTAKKFVLAAVSLLFVGGVLAYIGMVGTPAVPVWFEKYFNELMNKKLVDIAKAVVSYIKEHYILLTKEEYSRLLEVEEELHNLRKAVEISMKKEDLKSKIEFYSYLACVKAKRNAKELFYFKDIGYGKWHGKYKYIIKSKELVCYYDKLLYMNKTYESCECYIVEPEERKVVLKEVPIEFALP